MYFLKLVIIVDSLFMSTQSFSALIDLSGMANNGNACSTSSVVGNNGGSTTCYGLFDGNDDKNDQYQIGSDIFSFLGKDEEGDILITGAGTTSGD